MARRKENLDVVLKCLIIEKCCPMMMSRSKAAEVTGISRRKIAELIARGCLEVQDGKISAISLASYLCG